MCKFLVSMCQHPINTPPSLPPGMCRALEHLSLGQLKQEDVKWGLTLFEVSRGWTEPPASPPCFCRGVQPNLWDPAAPKVGLSWQKKQHSISGTEFHLSELRVLGLFLLFMICPSPPPCDEARGFGEMGVTYVLSGEVKQVLKSAG